MYMSQALFKALRNLWWRKSSKTVPSGTQWERHALYTWNIPSLWSWFYAGGNSLKEIVICTQWASLKDGEHTSPRPCPWTPLESVSTFATGGYEEDRCECASPRRGTHGLAHEELHGLRVRAGSILDYRTIQNKACITDWEWRQISELMTQVWELNPNR